MIFQEMRVHYLTLFLVLQIYSTAVDPFISDNGDEEVELGWIIQDSTDATR